MMFLLTLNYHKLEIGINFKKIAFLFLSSINTYWPLSYFQNCIFLNFLKEIYILNQLEINSLILEEIYTIIKSTHIFNILKSLTNIHLALKLGKIKFIRIIFLY
jgi:hypothetical protein